MRIKPVSRGTRAAGPTHARLPRQPSCTPAPCTLQQPDGGPRLWVTATRFGHPSVGLGRSTRTRPGCFKERGSTAVCPRSARQTR